jgi:hypothetical protein
MKKNRLIAIIYTSLLLGIVGFSSSGHAATCAANTSPTAACTDLLINTNSSNISVNYPVTTGASTNAAEVASGVTVTQFTNSSSLISTTGGLFDSGLYINTGSTITTLNNLGTMDGYAGLLNPGSIGTLNNSGVIGTTTGSIYGLVNTGTVSNLVNSGTITSREYAVSNGNGATITTFTNTGSIIAGFGYYGITNNTNGTISTLNNAQNGLTYSGKLPTNYNIIINSPTSYGSLAATLPSGAMNFGVDTTRSTLPTGVSNYSSVLSGLTNSNLVRTTGNFVGGLVTTSWILNNSSGTNWNLQTTKTVATAPVVAGSSAGTNLAYVFTGQSTNATAQSNGVTIGAAVSGLTQAQVNQLQNVHAEGYSSNMTIGLEQMAHITNTVMDRIHAPMSASPSTKVYQDDEGRYIWADAAAVKGTVNNYNNLAGFGYNLYDVIFGGDIKRSKDGGFGVFAGTGSTSMTESQQVTQNFNTTNFYAGLYGALNFAEQVKLSGALGYMYGSTNANRSAPNVGDLVGGNATSSFKSNGVYAAAKLAKAYQAQNFTVSPFVGASYSQLWMGGASEQGGNTFNYGINSATAYTAVTFAGADFIYPLLKGTNDPLSLIGFYKFGYDWYANSASAHTVTATTSFNGNTQSFAQVGANMGPVSNMVGLGIQGGITKEISARIGAVASYNTYGHEYGGGAELRFKF